MLDRVADEQGIGLRFTDYREMLERKEIDVVFIATPHFLHYQMIMDALRAGKHVLCEKPLAMNRGEAEEMVRTADGLGLKLGCHYNRRQTAQVKLLKDIVSRDVLGEVYAVNIKWMARYTGFMFSPNSAWRTEKSKAGEGILIGSGSHMIDAAFTIMGSHDIQSISANISSRLTGLEVDDIIATRKNRVVSVSFKKAYMPADGKEVLETGKFTNWLGNGCHPISFLLSVGGKVKSVTTLCGSRGQGSVILEFENGIMRNLHLADGPQLV